MSFDTQPEATPDTDGDGVITIPVSVPSWAMPGQTIMRFRWSTDFNIGSTGTAPDGEVEDYTVTLNAVGAGGTVLSGQVFLDDGIGGGTTHDGSPTGGEIGGQYATISIIETGTETPVTSANVNPDGTWQATLPDGFTSPISVVATPANGFLAISEAVGTAPVGSNPSTTDGRLDFTPATNTTYSGIDFGLIPEPTLTQNQTSAITGGQVVDLPHVYTAGSAGIVSFALTDQIESPAGSFSQIILGDANCDGVGDSVLAASMPVTVGQTICLTVRTQAGGRANA